MGNKKSFGEYAQQLRQKAGLGLREAARQMGFSAAYLSQVERNRDAPSKKLIAAMATAYKHSPEEICSAAERSGVVLPAMPAARAVEELKALYRVGGMFTSEEVENMVRRALKELGVSEEEIQQYLAGLRSDDLLRLHKELAPEIKPRFLSKRAISQLAYLYLAKNGLEQASYSPPTPLELIVEGEKEVSYIIDDLPSTDGDPVVLGRTRWNIGKREVTINRDLADSSREPDEHRFSFTLAHELFHAIEHLSLSPPDGALKRTAQPVQFIDRAPHRPLSAAERAVEAWTHKEKPRSLRTPEDWREWQANTFASALLMPEWSVCEIFEQRTGVESIYAAGDEIVKQLALEVAGEIVFGGKVYLKSLAQVFGVSRQAMAIRLLDLGVVREVQG